MQKKFLSLFLVAILLVSLLAACAKAPVTGDTPADNGDVEEPEDTDETGRGYC